MNQGTFNTLHFGETGRFGGHFPVWARVEHVLTGGGYFDLSEDNPLTGKKFAAGDVIPAGTMLHYSGVGGKLTIIPNSDADATVEAGKCNGLLWNDVCIPDNAVSATGAVVTQGRIYADRVYAKNHDGSPVKETVIGLPVAVEAMLPMIEFVRE